MSARSTVSQPGMVELRLEHAIAWVGVALLAGCASTPPAKRDSLSFLESGHVTQEDVRAHLGASASTFERGHVLAYRLRRTPDGYRVMAPVKGSNRIAWEEVDYDLVLAFDDAGVLRDHNLIAIHDAPAAR